MHREAPATWPAGVRGSGGAMDIRELRFIVAVADAGSFARAAEQLVTRQAVAKTMAAVEAETDLRVLERCGGRLVPTERGADLVADARRTVRFFNETIGPYLTIPDYASAARRRRQQAPSHLRIALVTGLARWGMPPRFFERLRADHPQTMLSVEEMSSDAVVDAVARGAADLGFAATHPELVAPLESKRLFGGALWVVMLDGNPLASKERLTLADLDERPLVTGGPRDHCHRFILGRCREAGVSPRVVGNATDTETIASLMMDYGALCPGSDPAVVELPAGLVARIVEAPGAEGFGNYVLRDPTRALSSEAREVWEGLGCVGR